MKNKEVEDLLDTIPANKARNMIEDNKPLAEAIAYFLEMKEKGDPRTHVSLRWFYLHKLRERFGGPKTVDTVLKFVRDVLGRDPKTGKKV